MSSEHGELQNDAGRLQKESLPAGNPAGGTQQRQAGDRTGKPLDAGLAGIGTEVDSGRGIRGRLQVSARTRDRRIGGVNSNAPDANGNNRGGRAGDGATADQLDHVIGDEDGIGDGGLTAKYRDNIAAIKIIKATETFGRVATPDERTKLALYVAKGVVKFAQYSRAIIDALKAHGVSAEQIKPYLKQFYAATKQAVDDATFDRMDDDGARV
jgi:hypothetical protein